MKVKHIKKFVKKHAFAFLIIPLLGIAIIYYSVNLSNLKALVGIVGTQSVTEITINNAAKDGDIMNINDGDCVITFVNDTDNTNDSDTDCNSTATIKMNTTLGYNDTAVKQATTIGGFGALTNYVLSNTTSPTDNKFLITHQGYDIPDDNVEISTTAGDDKISIIAANDLQISSTFTPSGNGGVQSETTVEIVAPPIVNGDIMNIDNGNCVISFVNTGTHDLDCSDNAAAINIFLTDADDATKQANKIAIITGLTNYTLSNNGTNTTDNKFLIKHKGNPIPPGNVTISTTGQALNKIYLTGTIDINLTNTVIGKQARQSVTNYKITQPAQDGDIMIIDNNCTITFTEASSPNNSDDSSTNCTGGIATIEIETVNSINTSKDNQATAIAIIGANLTNYNINNPASEIITLTHKGNSKNGIVGLLKGITGTADFITLNSTADLELNENSIGVVSPPFPSITNFEITTAAQDGDIMNIDNGDCIIAFKLNPPVSDWNCTTGNNTDGQGPKHATINSNSTADVQAQSIGNIGANPLTNFNLSYGGVGTAKFILTKTVVPMSGIVTLQRENPTPNAISLNAGSAIKLNGNNTIIGVVGTQSVTNLTITTAAEPGDELILNPGSAFECKVTFIADTDSNEVNDLDCINQAATIEINTSISPFNNTAPLQMAKIASIINFSDYTISGTGPITFTHTGDPIDGNLAFQISGLNVSAATSIPPNTLGVFGQQSVTTIKIEAAAANGDDINIDNNCVVAFTNGGTEDLNCTSGNNTDGGGPNHATINTTVTGTAIEQADKIATITGLTNYALSNGIVGDNKFVITHVSEPAVAGKVTIKKTVGAAANTIYNNTNTIDLSVEAIVSPLSTTLPYANSGPISGGTLVSITTDEFDSFNSFTPTVTFDGNPGTSVAVTGAKTFTAITPAGTAGGADVVVSQISGDTTYTATITNGFTYLSGPTITSVFPNIGVLTAGTIVEIETNGFPNFTSSPTVKFGTTTVVSANVTLLSTNKVKVIVPAGTAGSVPVEVTYSSQTATLPSGYTYTTSPSITEVTHNVGLPTGGTDIIVKTINFTPFGPLTSVSVEINNIPVTATPVMDTHPYTTLTGTSTSRTLKITLPAYGSTITSPTPVNVKVNRPAITPTETATLTNGFTYNLTVPGDITGDGIVDLGDVDLLRYSYFEYGGQRLPMLPILP